MIKAVLFDFGQTLVDSADGFRGAEKQAQEKIFRNLSLTSWEEFLSNYRRIRKDFHAKSQLSRKAIWEEVYWYYCREPETQLLEKWECEYWEKVKAETTIFPETERVLENLRTEYKVALITNTQGQKITNAHRISEFPELERFFDVIIVAGEDGIPPKPDPKPFLLCLEQLEVDPGQAVYVGDDWRNDICGARDIGMQPIWLKHHSVNRTWPTGDAGVPVITNLEKLLELDSILSSG